MAPFAMYAARLAVIPAVEQDELKQYLLSRILADAMSRMSRPLVDLNCKVLKWWQAKETKWPNLLCKMVKQ